MFTACRGMGQHGPASLPAPPGPQSGEVRLGPCSPCGDGRQKPLGGISPLLKQGSMSTKGRTMGTEGQGGGVDLGPPLWRLAEPFPRPRHTHAFTPHEARWPVPGLELEGPSRPPPGAAPSALWFWMNCSISLCQVLPSESGAQWWSRVRCLAWLSHPQQVYALPSSCTPGL